MNARHRGGMAGGMPYMAKYGCLLAFTLAMASCGERAPSSPEAWVFPGTAAVKVRGSGGRFLLLLETLQPQLRLTSPLRTASLVNARGEIATSYAAPEGWILVDAVAHPSGDVSVLTLRVDSTASYPLRVVVLRFGADGTRREFELSRLPPPDGTEVAPVAMFSLDRARLVAHGEDVYAVVRWANNSVQGHRLGFDGRVLEQKWAAWVEPPAMLFTVGIVGGGFDNFHQGDNALFVHADVDEDGNLYVAVVGTAELLAAHDAFFAEDLSSGADPGHFDFGAAVVTRVSSTGNRGYARLLGSPGRDKRLLNLRTVRDSVVLVGRAKTGNQPGSWDAWILSVRGADGLVEYERNIDVQDGDMFWDVAALPGDRLVAVGCTAYVQNPVGLSVSDARDPLALVLDSGGNVQTRIALPRGPAGRGNEAMSVSVGDRIAISGVQNAPGTHAEVHSDAILSVRDSM